MGRRAEDFDVCLWGFGIMSSILISGNAHVANLSGSRLVYRAAGVNHRVDLKGSDFVQLAVQPSDDFRDRSRDIFGPRVMYATVTLNGQPRTLSMDITTFQRARAASAQTHSSVQRTFNTVMQRTAQAIGATRRCCGG